MGNLRVRVHLRGCAAISALTATMMGGPAFAQATPDTQAAATTPAAGNPNQLGDIVVTAQHRTESLQKTPISIAAFSSAQLEKQGAVDIRDLTSLTPSFVVAGNNQLGEFPISIRGISSTTSGIASDNPVAVYIDGVYIGAPGASVFEFSDVDRIEILNGPQGTLYGRNATGGAINVLTRQPTKTLQGEVSAEFGSFNTARLSAYISGPLADTVQFKVSGYFDRTDGFETNIYDGTKVNGTQNYGGRVALKAEPSDRLDVTISGDYAHQEDGAAFHSLSPGPFYWNAVDVNAPVTSKRDMGGISGTMNYNFDGAKLTSITAWRSVTINYLSDSDAGPTTVYESIFEPITQHQVTEELRLVSSNDSRFKWQIGGFYFHQFATFHYDAANAAGFYAHYRTTSSTDSYAAFAQFDYKIFEPLTATAGLRYSSETKDYFIENTGATGNFLISPTNETINYHALTPHFSLNWQITPTILAYASATRGFRAGGFDLTSVGPAYAPEYVWSYEAGIKSDLLDHHLRLNLAGFHYDYTDLQVRQNPAPGIVITTNAASAKVNGVEFSATLLPVHGLRFEAGGSYVHATYDQFTEGTTVLDGHYLARAPKFQIHGIADYDLDLQSLGDIDGSATVQHQSKQYFNEFNVPLLSGAAYTTVDARLTWTPRDARNFSVSLIARNLSNKRFITNALAIGTLYYDATVNEPRNFMASIRYKF